MNDEAKAKRYRLGEIWDHEKAAILYPTFLVSALEHQKLEESLATERIHIKKQNDHIKRIARKRDNLQVKLNEATRIILDLKAEKVKLEFRNDQLESANAVLRDK